jgi:hypothetical protein
VHQLESLLLSTQANYRIEYEPDKPRQQLSPVRLQIHSPYGLGEDTYIPDAHGTTTLTPAALAG